MLKTVSEYVGQTHCIKCIPLITFLFGVHPVLLASTCRHLLQYWIIWMRSGLYRPTGLLFFNWLGFDQDFQSRLPQEFKYKPFFQIFLIISVLIFDQGNFLSSLGNIYIVAICCTLDNKILQDFVGPCKAPVNVELVNYSSNTKWVSYEISGKCPTSERLQRHHSCIIIIYSFAFYQNSFTHHNSPTKAILHKVLKFTMIYIL